jgi:hypothetical protein
MVIFFFVCYNKYIFEGGGCMKFFVINNKKLFIFFIFSLLLVFVLYNCFNYDVNLNDIDDIYSSKKENISFVTGVFSSKSAGVYNKIDGIYYFSSGSFDLNNLKIISPYKVRYLVLSNDDNYYKLLAYSEKYYKEINIKVLDIPIMSVSSIDRVNSKPFNSTVDLGDSSSNIYTDVYVEFMENKEQDNYVIPVIYSTGKIRFRGATSMMFEKKSYKLELDSKASFSGMDSDDDWILDALYADKSKIRNILASEIWNFINDNQRIQNDLHGKFVELFVDNEYMGLYVLKEKVGKKIVGIHEGGLIAKSYTHINDDIIDNFINNDVSLYQQDDEMILENFELKKYNSYSLSNFIRNMKQYYVSRNYDSINESFYIDNYLNYKIFISLICAMDNVSKNQYYSMDGDDSKVLITPWDMDLTFGLDYSNDTFLKSINFFDNYGDSAWLNNYIFSDMDERTFNSFKNRYWQLRNNGLNMDFFNSLLDGYKKNIIDGGSVLRDSERWYEYDVESEIEYIRKWINNRIQFLDQYLAI